MELRLGQFRNILLFDTIIGTNTVSLNTLEQSKLSVAYSCLLVAIFGVETLIYYYNQITIDLPEPYSRQISRTISVSFCVYSILQGVWDHKTKISAFMNLEAIEGRLASHGIVVSGKRLLNIIGVGLILLNICLQVLVIIGNLNNLTNSHLSITKYITSVIYCGCRMSLVSSIVMFQTKALMIQKAIAEGFSEISRIELGTRPSNILGTRRLRPIYSQFEKWMFLSELQGSLDMTLNMMNDHGWMQIVLFRGMFEIGVPMLFVDFYFQEEMNVISLSTLIASVCFIIVVCSVERVQQEKKVSNNQLLERFDGSSRRKHQLLANIHRGQRPFSCTFFDINYSLLFVIFENFMFVATSLYSYWKKE